MSPEGFGASLEVFDCVIMWVGGLLVVLRRVLFGVLLAVFDGEFGWEVLWWEVAWCASGGV